MKPRILLDCDGVLADFHSSCVTIIEQLTGKQYDLKEMVEWDIFDALGVSAEVRDETYRLMHQPGWCSRINPYPQAFFGYEQLCRLGDVYVCTSPMMMSATWTSERDEWLLRHFKVRSKKIIHTSAKYICSGDVLIDDRVVNLEKWKLHNPNGLAIQWIIPDYKTKPWNGPYTSDWNDLADIITTSPKLERIWHHE